MLRAQVPGSTRKPVSEVPLFSQEALSSAESIFGAAEVLLLLDMVERKDDSGKIARKCFPFSSVPAQVATRNFGGWVSSTELCSALFLRFYQGDHAFVKKVAQNVAKTMYCQNYYINFTVVKSSPKTFSTFVIYKNYTK
jgi:hypothetical protein